METGFWESQPCDETVGSCSPPCNPGGRGCEGLEVVSVDNGRGISHACVIKPLSKTPKNRVLIIFHVREHTEVPREGKQGREALNSSPSTLLSASFLPGSS